MPIQEKTMAEAAGMRYVQIPMTTHVVPTPAQLAQFLGIVNDPASGPVLFTASAAVIGPA